MYLPRGRERVHRFVGLDRMFYWLIVLPRRDGVLLVRVGVLAERARLHVRLGTWIVRAAVAPARQTSIKTEVK